MDLLFKLYAVERIKDPCVEYFVIKTVSCYMNYTRRLMLFYVHFIYHRGCLAVTF